MPEVASGPKGSMGAQVVLPVSVHVVVTSHCPAPDLTSCIFASIEMSRVHATRCKCIDFIALANGKGAGGVDTSEDELIDAQEPPSDW